MEIHVINDVAISSDAIGDIFDRFYRVESSRNSKPVVLDWDWQLLKASLNNIMGSICRSNSELTSVIMTLPLKQIGAGNEKINFIVTSIIIF